MRHGVSRRIRAMTNDLAGSLSRAGSSVAADVPLSGLCWYRIGGPADLVAEPADAAAFGRTLRVLQEAGVPFFVMGDGSNLLFDDAGFRGVVVRITRALGGLSIAGTEVRAGAGLWVPCFARRLAHAGLSGLEHIVGIPGTLGGLVVMNGGSLRKGVGTQVTEVAGFRRDGRPFVLDHAQCRFAYRASALQGGGRFVTEVAFRLAERAPREILREQIKIMAARRLKFPKRHPNCGSVFLSNPTMYGIVGPPGKAIEAVGLRGERLGGAQIAPYHGNFIINVGGARSADVLGLIALARSRVHATTGYWMDCEVIHVRPDGRAVPAHVSAMERAGGGVPLAALG